MCKNKKPICDWERIERDEKYPVEITQRTESEVENGIDGKKDRR